MKKYLFLLTLCLSSSAFAQFKLSGKIDHYAGDASPGINIPMAYGFVEQNLTGIPVGKKGTFTINLPIKQQKFATLMYQGNVYTLMLHPTKTLSIVLDATTKGIKFTGGTAMAENILLERINLTEPPSFLLDDKYTPLDLNGLKNQLLKPYYATRDRKIATVNQSAINPAYKKAIIAEIRYIAYNNLHELTDIGVADPATLNKFVAEIYSKANVRPEVMPAGPQYYTFASNYLTEVEKKLPGRPASLLTRWESAVKYLPAAVAEQFGYKLIVRAFYNGNSAMGKQLAAVYLKKFPAGVYAADVKIKAAKLK